LFVGHMPYDSTKHHRRSIRLDDYDYRGDGAYFVTICVGDRVCAFGSIVDAKLRATRRGLVAMECWHDIPNHRPYVELDQFVVMPNHVHGIFWIVGGLERATQVSPLQGTDVRPKAAPGSVGAIIGSYKAAVSRTVNRLRAGAANNLWQPNYYEHVIRTQKSLENIREYIFTNPQRWTSDRENPDGDGTDDVEAFIRSLDHLARRQGNTSVAPAG
jgi:putative transposase